MRVSRFSPEGNPESDRFLIVRVQTSRTLPGRSNPKTGNIPKKRLTNKIEFRIAILAYAISDICQSMVNLPAVRICFVPCMRAAAVCLCMIAPAPS